MRHNRRERAVRAERVVGDLVPRSRRSWLGVTVCTLGGDETTPPASLNAHERVTLRIHNTIEMQVEMQDALSRSRVRT